MTGLAAWTQSNRWCWAGGIVLALWIYLAVSMDRLDLHSISGIIASAAFLAIVAEGQTFVIASGRGNIDLSSAGTITLSAFLAMQLGDGSGAGLVEIVLSVAALGLVVGLLNGVLVAVLGMPAIVVTLAIGYVLATGAQLANQGLPPTFVYPWLSDLASGRIVGFPAICAFAVALIILAEIVMRRTSYGRQLAAVGQNYTAAGYASIRVSTITIGCFVVSSLLASLAGLLLSARIGGAFLDMGTSYLIQSVGAVVVGGTSILGGNTTFVGTMLGAVLLVLLVTIMQVSGLPIGIQEIIQGLGITLILALAGAPK
jgi:ribose transport system permease protein